MKILPIPHPITDAQSRHWAAYTLKEAKQLLIVDKELWSLREQSKRHAELKRTYLTHLKTLRDYTDLQNRQLLLVGSRLHEKTLRIEGLIDEKNKYRYQRKWALFGAKSSLLSLVLVGAAVAALK